MKWFGFYFLRHREWRYLISPPASGHSSGFDRWLIYKQFRHQREGQSEIIVKRRKSHLNIMIVFHLICIESSCNPGIEASEHNWFVSTAAQPFISFGVWLTQVSCCPTHPNPVANSMRQSLSYQLKCLFTQLRKRSLKLWHLSTVSSSPSPHNSLDCSLCLLKYHPNYVGQHVRLLDHG